TSAMFFGTRAGRFATLFLIIPFGGSLIIVEGAIHLVHVITGHKQHASVTFPQDAFTPEQGTEVGTIDGEPEKSNEIGDKPAGDQQRNQENPAANTPSAESSIEDDPAPSQNTEPTTADPGSSETSSGTDQTSLSGPSSVESLSAVDRPAADVSGDILLVSAPVSDEAGGAAADMPDDSVLKNTSPATDSASTAGPSPDRTTTDERDVDVRNDGSASEQSDKSSAAPSDATAIFSERTPASEGAPDPPQTEAATSERILVPSRGFVDEGLESVQQVYARQVSSLSLVLALGFVLMGLIHLSGFRRWAMEMALEGWRLLKYVAFDLPQRLLRLPIVRQIWQNRQFVRFRRTIVGPLLFTSLICDVIPFIIQRTPLGWWWFAAISILSSAAINSRLGRDAEELTVEWIGNTWYNLRARVVMALFDLVVEVFKTIIGFIERVLYAVDEWLRFHSGESWVTIVLKAVLGVAWSLVSFFVRIYLNLLIEPQINPIKHFPVVTVAHKITVPLIPWAYKRINELLSPILGEAIATSLIGTTLFLFPGVFGFLVWELKENWRLYAANRRRRLDPVPVGSHGETIPRLMKPGLHSGTLPKLFRRMRRLERKEASFRRFSLRRAAREQLEHIDRDVRRFVERELLTLLQLHPLWSDLGLHCGQIVSASNSIQIEIRCDRLGRNPVRLLIQEQSGWVVGSVFDSGWLLFASADQLRSFEHALEGCYRKAGIDLVREQIEQGLVHNHPYDVNEHGLTVWPDSQFDREVTVDLHRPGTVRPVPISEAAIHNLHSTARDQVVFSDSDTTWDGWERRWQSLETASANGLSLAYMQKCRLTLLK
ncbi:MAG: hypothetical protein KDA85_09165, partial [Planctomycetaceae bacterium]|nr:hypothetical protein [Planctomycetaceae bacterium]